MGIDDKVLSLADIEKKVNSRVSMYLYTLNYNERQGHEYWIAVKNKSPGSDVQIPPNCHQKIYVELKTSYPEEVINKMIPNRIIDNIYVHYIFNDKDNTDSEDISE